MANHGDIQNEMSVSSQAAVEARFLKQFFEAIPHNRFTTEKLIGQGSWGFTLQMLMRSADRSGPVPTVKLTRFVMKRSLASVGEKNILTEIDALNRLRGSMHIAQPSHILDSPRWNRAVASLKGPVLLMDWIENGLLCDFTKKNAESNEPLPNRLLWFLFLCLCRMVVALTWPPRDLGVRVPQGLLALEAIPPRNERGQRPPKSRLVHGDFHYRNIMIDKHEPNEHNLFPVLKLIDFGMSRDVPVRAGEPEDLIVKTNIKTMGEVMLGLLRGNVRGGPGMMDITYKGIPKTIRSFATDLDKLSPSYGAPPHMVAEHQNRMDNLDPDIRSLVAACLAVNVADRPDIEELISIVERNARDKTPADYSNYRYSGNETDYAIKTILDSYIDNA
ncbi:hypothetical protein GGS21DRAFT_362610 [Xylaria nigripes]|nr:hypothetical protein GGS21DRAFT_362610 [Xylaria nigripes]